MFAEPMSLPSAPHLSVHTLTLSLLLLFVWCQIALQSPVLQNEQTNDRTSVNSTCITEDNENGTLIISSGTGISSNKSDQQSPTAQFNERRRDMFFEDGYNTVKHVEVIDTLRPTNRSENSTQILLPSSTPSPSSSNEVTSDPSVVSSSTPEIGLYNGNHQLPILPQRPNVLLPKLEATGRPSCLQSPDDTFCEAVNVGTYPNRSLIRNEIDFTPQQFNDIFGLKEIDGRKSYVDEDDNEEEKSVCRKVPRVIYPQMAKNQANQWIYVVNEVEYTQAVVAEICEKPGKPCSHLENLPMGMYSRCRQKYSYKRLLALHPTEKRTYPDSFKFPSCCSCYIKYDDYLGRSNGRKLESKVDVSRESRAMTPATALPPADSAPDPNGMSDNNNNSSTIDILSQSGSDTNSTALPATGEQPSTNPAIAPQ